MDNDLVDAARRVLFACTGVRRQEHPELRQLGEFLHRYSLTQMSSSGEAGRCDAENRPTFEYAPGRARIRNNGVKPYALHDNYEMPSCAPPVDSHALGSTSSFFIRLCPKAGCRSWRP